MSSYQEPGAALDQRIADLLGLTCAAEHCPPFSTEAEAAEDVVRILRAQVFAEPVPAGISVIMLARGLSRAANPYFKGHAVGQTREHAICLAAVDLIERNGKVVYGSRVNWKPVDK
jgi:hypothetical protein